MRPASKHITPRDRCIVRKCLFDRPAVQVTLKRDEVRGCGVPVQPETTLPETPRVRRVVAIRKHSAIPVEVLSINAIEKMFAQLSPVTDAPEVAQFRAAST